MKRAKSAVHYREGSGDRLCKNCTMWRNGACTAVAGRIYPEGVCDIFERK